MVYSQFQLIFK